MIFYPVSGVALFLSLICCVVYSEQVQNCGGTYAGYQYSISSPNYPDRYPTNQNCIYTLTGNRLPQCEENYYLQFLDFDLSSSEACKSEFLRVGDHHVFCGSTQKIQKFAGKNGTLKLVFHTSNQETNHRGFKILVTVECSKSRQINPLTHRSVNFTSIENDKDLNSGLKAKEKLSARPLVTKNNIVTYLFVPPAEKNDSSVVIKLPETTSPVTKNKSRLMQHNTEVGHELMDEEEPLAQVFNPNCEHVWPKNSMNHDRSINPRLNTKILGSFLGHNQGPNNNYYPNADPNFYNPYPPNNFNFYPNNFVPGNPGFGLPPIDGVNNNFPFGPSSECCRTVYSAPRFLLASPGFPNFGYVSNPFECGYTIQKSSPQVCNLRLYFKFFSLGSDDAFCSNGYLDVDGQRVCGCRTGFNIVSPFNDVVKRLNVKYVGVPRSKFSGFLIEVVQENCNYNFNRFKKDASNVDGAKEKRHLGYSYSAPNKRFIEGNINQQFYLRSRGRANYASNCQAKVFFDWVLASKEVYLRNAKCQSNSLIPRSNLPFAKLASRSNGDQITLQNIGNCEVIDAREGVLSSPGYPAGYVDNFYKCYSFKKQQGFSRLDLSFFDFDVESSPNCERDYIQFSGQSRRYCGQMLIGQKLSFDFSNTDVLHLNFKSNAQGRGRGFSLAYEQIAV